MHIATGIAQRVLVFLVGSLIWDATSKFARTRVQTRPAVSNALLEVVRACPSNTAIGGFWLTALPIIATRVVGVVLFVSALMVLVVVTLAVENLVVHVTIMQVVASGAADPLVVSGDVIGHRCVLPLYACVRFTVLRLPILLLAPFESVLSVVVRSVGALRLRGA